MFIATINRNLKSYLFAIIGAEYVLNWLPVGTHDWFKFVEPDDLEKLCKKNLLRGKTGYLVNPSQLTEKWFSNTSVANTQDINLLYIGRIKKEKGTDSLFQILESIKINLNLTIVSTNQNLLKLEKKHRRQKCQNK